jgi:anti-sigma B factor antagonist
VDVSVAHDATAPAIALSITSVGYRTVVSADGEIDLTTIDTFRAALQGVLHSAEREVWIDLTLVTFMDSTGLHALVDIQRALDGDHRSLAVIASPGAITRSIEHSGLDRVLSVHPDRQSANHAR